MYEPISNSPEKEKGELLIIYVNPEVGEPGIFERGMYLSVYYFCVVLRIYLQICRRNRCWKREI